MRILNWNIEHMNSWWTGGAAPVLKQSATASAISPAVTDVPDLARRVAATIRGIDPDVVAIQEGAGPPEMEQFFNEMVDDTGARPWRFISGGGAQALVVAARLDRGVVTDITPGPDIVGPVDLRADYLADIEAEDDPELDPELDESRFARKPLPVIVHAHGADVLILNNHLKSKFVNNGEQRWNAGGIDRRDFIREALVARRRISAEAFRIRRYLDVLLTAAPDTAVLVTGDLNDGPGADYFEERYLTHSVVDRVFGSIFHPAERLRHALFDRGITEPTAVFHDFITREERDLFLDHIGIGKWLDEHWIDWTSQVERTHYDANSIHDPSRAERDQLPSDHRPVVVDIEPPTPGGGGGAGPADLPHALRSAWQLNAGGLFLWQRRAIETPLHAALLDDPVKQRVAEAAVDAVRGASGITATNHAIVFERAVEMVVSLLDPASTVTDADAAIDGVGADFNLT